MFSLGAISPKLVRDPLLELAHLDGLAHVAGHSGSGAPHRLGALSARAAPEDRDWCEIVPSFEVPNGHSRLVPGAIQRMAGVTA